MEGLIIHRLLKPTRFLFIDEGSRPEDRKSGRGNWSASYLDGCVIL